MCHASQKKEVPASFGIRSRRSCQRVLVCRSFAPTTHTRTSPTPHHGCQHLNLGVPAAQSRCVRVLYEAGRPASGNVLCVVDAHHAAQHGALFRTCVCSAAGEPAQAAVTKPPRDASVFAAVLDSRSNTVAV